LALLNPDFTTAKRIAAVITDFIGATTAEPLDPSTVQLAVPQRFQGKVIALVTEVEQLQIEPDYAAKIFIDERSGIIVMGCDVRVSTVAVAQGNLTMTSRNRRRSVSLPPSHVVERWSFHQPARDITTAAPSAWPYIENINNQILTGEMY